MELFTKEEKAALIDSHKKTETAWLSRDNEQKTLIDELNHQLEDGAEQISTHLDAIGGLQKIKAELKETNENLAGKLVEADEERCQLREIVNNHQQRLSDKEETIRHQTSDIDALRRKLDESHKVANELSQQLQASKSDEAVAIMIKTQLDQLLPKLDEATEANQSLKDQVHQANLEKVQAITQSENAGQRVADTKELYADQIKTLKDRVADLEKQRKADEKKTR